MKRVKFSDSQVSNFFLKKRRKRGEGVEWARKTFLLPARFPPGIVVVASTAAAILLFLNCAAHKGASRGVGPSPPPTVPGKPAMGGQPQVMSENLWDF